MLHPATFEIPESIFAISTHWEPPHEDVVGRDVGAGEGGPDQQVTGPAGRKLSGGDDGGRGSPCRW